MEAYKKTQSKGPIKFKNYLSNIVKKMVTSISNTGRDKTMNYWYTSMPLISELLEAYNLAVVRTLRKNKK